MVFAALLSDQVPPELGADHPGDHGPLGAASGAERLHLRIAAPAGSARPDRLADDAPAIDQLAAFLGRPVSAG